jgi:hypothetical protein
MTTMLRDWLMLWRCARQFRPQAAWAIAHYAHGAGAIVAVLVLTYLGKDVGKIVGLGIGIPVAVSAILGWFRMLPGAVRLHAPTHAQLVPRLALALLCIGIPALLFAVASHPQLRLYLHHHHVTMVGMAALPALALCVTACAVALRRWRTMLAAPVALVAGRMTA